MFRLLFHTAKAEGRGGTSQTGAQGEPRHAFIAPLHSAVYPTEEGVALLVLF